MQSAIHKGTPHGYTYPSSSAYQERPRPQDRSRGEGPSSLISRAPVITLAILFDTQQQDGASAHMPFIAAMAQAIAPVVPAASPVPIPKPIMEQR